MGRDKALIPWGGSTLLSHARDQMRQITPATYIVGGPEAGDAEETVLADRFPGQGPLAGIHSALCHTETDWNLVLALDLPLVNAKLLAFILERCDRAEQAVAIRLGSHLQPLCAAYNRALLSQIEDHLNAGDLSIHRLLERASTRIIEEEELLAAGFRGEMLLNVNTPEDLKRARELTKTLHVE